MSKTYYPLIGLEIHAELNTKSKMFCACKNDPDEVRPNINICPICMAHPGTLPVANKQAIENVIKVGLALGANIADFSEFDRKNYFYPDIPKGYQLSQYKYPIVSGGKLNGVSITRIHLEEDTGLSKHDRGDFTLVDYNRVGVPLMELVTDALTGELTTAKAAADFAREFQLLLRTLGVGEANLEKGEMRVEPNISISDDPNKLGTKVEVKNLNSFKSVEKAIEYEFARMIALYEAGRENEIVQETRGWDENKQSTFSQRSKENANDYRYFPDPDLPKMKLHSAFDIEQMKKELPELPWEKRGRYAKDYGLREDDIELLVINPDTYGKYFEMVASLLKTKEEYKILSNFILSDAVGIINAKGGLPFVEIPPYESAATLVRMFVEGKITSRGAKDMIAIMLQEEINPEEYAKEHGLLQENNADALKPIIEAVIAENEKMVTDYKGGKEAALQGLVGMVMKASKGSANPGLAMEILKDLLS